MVHLCIVPVERCAELRESAERRDHGQKQWTGWEKPAKEFFDAVFREIGEERRAGSIIVGDSLTSDIAGANRAGIKSCWYNPRGTENGTNATPDFEIKDVREILEIL